MKPLWISGTTVLTEEDTQVRRDEHVEGRQRKQRDSKKHCRMLHRERQNWEVWWLKVIEVRDYEKEEMLVKNEAKEYMEACCGVQISFTPFNNVDNCFLMPIVERCSTYVSRYSHTP